MAGTYKNRRDGNIYIFGCRFTYLMMEMAIRTYSSIRKYDNVEIASSPEVKLLVWAYQNPQEALEIGAKLAAVGILIWFLGALFKK